MTIRDAMTNYFGNQYKNYKGEIGLEIETESPTDYKIPKFSFWDVHNDGSLRQVGREYVLKAPMLFEKELPEALQEFKEKTEGIPFVQDSITTSVHVHLNILNENFVTLGNFLTIYSLVENLLIRFSGDDRRSNLFSLPMCDAEEIYTNIIRLINGIGAGRYGNLQFEPEHSKYGALNLSAITRYGSLELRSFRGVTDTEIIYQWVGLLYSIMQYAKQDKLIPPAIIMDFKDRGVEILSDIFGKGRDLIRLDNEVDLIEKNFWYSANIANAISNWDKLDIQPKSTKKVKSNDLERLSQHLYQRSFEALTYEQQYNVLNTNITENPEDIAEIARMIQQVQAAEAGTNRRRDQPTWAADATFATTSVARAQGRAERLTNTIPLQTTNPFTDEQPEFEPDEWHDDEELDEED